jgi:hypothetical protein
MANPNIAGSTLKIFGKVDYLTPGGTSALVLLPNSSTSNQVYKINQIVAANVSGSAAVNATVSIYTNGAVAKGSAPSGGTGFPIASTISVPVSASLIVTDKTTAIYLMEDQSITVTSGTASGITYTISYEILDGPAT